MGQSYAGTNRVARKAQHARLGWLEYARLLVIMAIAMTSVRCQVSDSVLERSEVPTTPCWGDAEKKQKVPRERLPKLSLAAAAYSDTIRYRT
jgi:hypothetical protein